MRVTMNIRVESVVYDGKLPISPKVFLFAARMLQKSVFPPIHVQRRFDGRYTLLSGRNRLAAHKLIGREFILASLAIPEDPRPDKQLVYARALPQADGFSLPEDRSYHRIM